MPEPRQRAQNGVPPVLPLPYARIYAAWAAAEDGIPEPLGCTLLRENSPAQQRFIVWRDKAHRSWPIMCRDCRREFRPARRGAKLCPECRRTNRR